LTTPLFSSRAGPRALVCRSHLSSPSHSHCHRGPAALARPCLKQRRAARARRTQFAIGQNVVGAPPAGRGQAPRHPRAAWHPTAGDPILLPFFLPLGLRSCRAPSSLFPQARLSLPALAPRSATLSSGELVQQVPRTKTSTPHRNLGHRRRCPPLGWGNHA
jgi:hypothetical protein